MTTKRAIDAYRKRLATITASEFPTYRLTAECINAVVAYYDADADGYSVKATLVGFTYRQGMGLFGTRTFLDITVCDACVFQRGDCDTTAERVITDATVHGIWRNADEDKATCETDLGA